MEQNILPHSSVIKQFNLKKISSSQRVSQLCKTYSNFMILAALYFLSLLRFGTKVVDV